MSQHTSSRLFHHLRQVRNLENGALDAPKSSNPNLEPVNMKANNTISTSSAETYYSGLYGVNLELDQRLVTGLWASIIIVLGIVLVLRLWQLFHSHLRHIYCLTANRVQQNYWSLERSDFWTWLKRDVIYAPLGKKRHNREIQLSSATNYGSLPGRIHTLLLALYVISNIVFCSLLNYRHQEKGALLAELRGRTGILATVNMIPLMVLAGRNNPAISILRVSFDSFNLFHRWIGRIVIVEAGIHVLAWYGAYNMAEGAEAVSQSFSGDRFLQFGLIAMVAMAVMLLQSLSPVRHAFYETFLNMHKVLAFLAMLGIYVHLEIANLPALPYIRIAVGIWMGEKLLRLGRVIIMNHSRRRGSTTCTIEALPGEACRLTFQLPKRMTIRPGSHVYAYIPRMSWWQSHPFSVAWTNPESEPPTGRILENISRDTPKSPNSVEKQFAAFKWPSQAPTSVSLIVAARTGMTRKIYDEAIKAESGTVQVAGFLEGPYAGHDSLASYGTVILFAGGAGITHHLIQIRHLIACAQAKTVATRKIVLVWTVRDVDAFTWVQTWMDEIMAMEGRKDMLKVLLYVTKPQCAADYQSPNGTIQSFQGRCSPAAVLDQELADRVGATMVSVCGPGGFADEVRAAVRARLHLGCIDLNEESFTW